MRFRTCRGPIDRPVSCQRIEPDDVPGFDKSIVKSLLKWWQIGGYSALKAVVDAPDFPKSAPFAPQFLESMGIVKDFWAEPSYAQLLLDMQKRVHDYVMADKGTAKEALDLLVNALHLV